MESLYDDSWLWLVILGFIIAFVLAFGLGANDVANSFGTSTGAKVLTIRQACILGSIFEILGAVLIGAKVSNTIRKGIVSPDLYTNGTEEMFMAGNTAALTGSCLWLLIATFLSLPVSGTHSIVGATLGFHLVVHGVNGVNGIQLILIVASWFISPLLSGFVSAILFKFVDIFILSKENSLENGLQLLPAFYAFTLAVNLFSIFFKGSELLHFDKIPLYGTFILTFVPAILIAILVHFFVVPMQRRKIQKQCAQLAESGEIPTISKRASSIESVFDQEVVITCHNNLGLDTFESPGYDVIDTKYEQKTDSTTQESGTKQPQSSDEKVIPTDSIIDDDDSDAMQTARNEVEDKPEIASLFKFLQVLTAIFGSFVHGGNDVSNAIGPLVALWITATNGSSAQEAPVPIWILVYGGIGISVGLWVWGRRVMKTMGEDLTKITPSSGFCIEIGSALTVLIASNIGIPVSTTHCKVGSVVIVGRVRSRESVDWKLFRNIILAWFVTLPVAGGLSALTMLAFKGILKF